MDSREYLNYVLDKLQERIRKLDDAILHGQKEIENMHEYLPLKQLDLSESREGKGPS